MTPYELNRLIWHTLDGIGFAVLCICKFVAVALLMLSPFIFEWILEGCPSLSEAKEMYIEDVKGGWR